MLLERPDIKPAKDFVPCVKVHVLCVDQSPVHVEGDALPIRHVAHDRLRRVNPVRTSARSARLRVTNRQCKSSKQCCGSRSLRDLKRDAAVQLGAADGRHRQLDLQRAGRVGVRPEASSGSAHGIFAPETSLSFTLYLLSPSV